MTAALSTTTNPIDLNEQNSLDLNVPSSFSPEFPRRLPLFEEDSLAYQTYLELFQEAQEASLPYYNVVVVESTNKHKKKKYLHIYDGTYFFKHADNISKKKNKIIDPKTNRTVKRIHLFSIKCFKLDENNLFIPVNLFQEKPNIKYYPVKDLTVKLKKYLDCTNSTIDVAPLKDENLALENKQLIRIFQHQIGSEILAEQFLPELIAQKKEEALLWYWCSAKKSIEGAIKFGNLYKERSFNFSRLSKSKVNQMFTHLLNSPKEIHPTENHRKAALRSLSKDLQ